MSIRELLAMDLIEARNRFGIGEPTWYRRCHEVWKREGVNPYDLLGKGTEAAEEKLAA
jgi:ubiquinone biosynthesis protein COQ4